MSFGPADFGKSAQNCGRKKDILHIFWRDNKLLSFKSTPCVMSHDACSTKDQDHSAKYLKCCRIVSPHSMHSLCPDRQIALWSVQQCNWYGVEPYFNSWLCSGSWKEQHLFLPTWRDLSIRFWFCDKSRQIYHKLYHLLLSNLVK